MDTSGDPLTGTTAIVTGGSRGIGREIALRLAGAGRTVVLTYRRGAEEAAATVATIEERGGAARAQHLELEDADGIDALFRLVGDLPPVGTLVANAAATAFKPIEAFNAPNLERSWATNARSFVLLAQRAVPSMRRLGAGRIVAVTSYGSTRAFPNYGALGADKAAVESWVRHMAAEWGPDAVTVNAVNGGVFDTASSRAYYAARGTPDLDDVVRRVPLRRTGTPAEAAAAVAFLCSADAAYITGQVLAVDGGLTVVAPPFPADFA
jgi:enoyl-[acyl-carrier protein] reductase III